MAEKNFDILPAKNSKPRKYFGIPLKIKKNAPLKTEPAPALAAAEWRRPRFRKWQKIVLAVFILCIIILALLAYLVLPEAVIRVKARTESVTRDLEIKVDKNQNKVDIEEQIIPGQIVEQEVTGKKTFSATGKRNVGKTASGFVHIYNFSKSTLILKAQTTTLYIGDRKYFFTQDVSNIRPTAIIGLEDQEVDPSSLIPPVPVVATAAGELYNLPVGTRIEIDNEVFGKQPKALYAVVAEEITGGTTKEIKVVTEADIAASYSALNTELMENEKKKLAAGNNGLEMLDGSFDFQTLEQSSTAIAGTETPEFEASVKAKLQALVFLKSDVRQLITERIKRYLPETKALREDTGNRLQMSFLSVDTAEGQGTINAHFEGEVEYKVDAEEIVNKVRGKTAEEIKEILLSRPEIKEADIKFYPFWVKMAPKFSKKISVEIERE